MSRYELLTLVTPRRPNKASSCSFATVTLLTSPSFAKFSVTLWMYDSTDHAPVYAPWLFEYYEAVAPSKRKAI